MPAPARRRLPIALSATLLSALTAGLLAPAAHAAQGEWAALGGELRFFYGGALATLAMLDCDALEPGARFTALERAPARVLDQVDALLLRQARHHAHQRSRLAQLHAQPLAQLAARRGFALGVRVGVVAERHVLIRERVPELDVDAVADAHHLARVGGDGVGGERSAQGDERRRDGTSDGVFHSCGAGERKTSGARSV